MARTREGEMKRIEPIRTLPDTIPNFRYGIKFVQVHLFGQQHAFSPSSRQKQDAEKLPALKRPLSNFAIIESSQPCNTHPLQHTLRKNTSLSQSSHSDRLQLVKPLKNGEVAYPRQVVQRQVGESRQALQHGEVAYLRQAVQL